MSWRIPEEVVFRNLDGEGVVLNLTTGMYYGLNATATLAWTLIGEGRSVIEIVAALVDQFDVSEATARGDFDLLVADLTSKGLLAID